MSAMRHVAHRSRRRRSASRPAAAGRAGAPAAEAAPRASSSKGRAPVSDKILQIKLPRPEEADLPNGIHLMVLQDRRAPQVSVQLSIRGAGGYYDPADQAGLAQFTAAMLREGTTTQVVDRDLRAARAPLRHAEREHGDGVRGRDASPPRRSPSTWTSCSTSWPTWCSTRRLRRTSSRATRRSAARSCCSSVRSPASSSPSASAWSSRAIIRTGGCRRRSRRSTRRRRDDLVDFHRTRYVPDHAVIAIAGDISMADAMKKITARFGAWKKAGVPVPQVADPAAVAKAGRLSRRAAELGADEPDRRRRRRFDAPIRTTSR